MQIYIIIITFLYLLGYECYKNINDASSTSR